MTSSRRTRAPNEVAAEAVEAAPQPAAVVERPEVVAAEVVPQGVVVAPPVVVAAVAGVAEEGAEEAELSGESRFSGNGRKLP